MNEMPTKFSKLIEFRWNCAAGFGFEVGKVGFELNDSSSDTAFSLKRKLQKFLLHEKIWEKLIWAIII